MLVTLNKHFLLNKTFFEVVVTDMWKAYCYRLSSRNKDKNLIIRLFEKLIYGMPLNKLESSL